jgi:hypothetical protein
MIQQVLLGYLMPTIAGPEIRAAFGSEGSRMENSIMHEFSAHSGSMARLTYVAGFMRLTDRVSREKSRILSEGRGSVQRSNPPP